MFLTYDKHARSSVQSELVVIRHLPDRYLHPEGPVKQSIASLMAKLNMNAEKENGVEPR